MPLLGTGDGGTGGTVNPAHLTAGALLGITNGDFTITGIPTTIDSISIPTNIKEGQPIQLSATTTAATNPGILDTLTYSWNFGDTTLPVVGQNPNHTFADNGNYNVTLTVTDKDGAATTQTVITKVDNVAPVIGAIVKPATT